MSTCGEQSLVAFCALPWAATLVLLIDEQACIACPITMAGHASNGADPVLTCDDLTAGHPFRFPDPMIEYHYTNNKSVLIDSVRRFGRRSLTRSSSSLSRASASSLKC